MDNFSVSDLEALQNILSPEEEEAYSQFSSGPVLSDPNKPMAPPHSKVTAKINRPNQSIWQGDEVNSRKAAQSDDRPQPEYEILYKQRVGAEDVFLGINDSDTSSRSCQDLSIKIELPGTQHKDISLDVEKTNLSLQAPKFRLDLPLPHSVHEKQGKAQWIAKDEILYVTLPIDKDDIPL